MDSADDQLLDAGAPRLPVKQPSTLTPEGLYAHLKQNFLKDAAHSEEWRDQARKDFDFVSGDQWEDETYRRMVREEKRVPITFNRTAAFIKVVAGLEINGRHEIVYLPRGTDEGVIVMNEDLCQASKWMGQQCDAEDSESEAFRDMITCGMGWTESRLDFETDPDGMYIEEQVNPIEMYWDRTARKKNLSDAQRVYRVRKMRLEDARALADSIGGDEVPDTELDASWAIGVEQKAVKPYEEVRMKTGRGNAYQEGLAEMDPNMEVHIVHCQWWERETYYRVAHPQTGEEIKLNADEFKQLSAHVKKMGAGKLTYAKQVRKVYKQAFLGGQIIGEVSNCPAADRFTFQCMTGELHRSKGVWNGLVRLMRDPQMWMNKLFSQIIHILNTTAKGGILAEADAFPDIKEAQRTYARPDAITIVADGAITKGKIMQKPGVGLAAPFVQMMEYSMRALPDVTGINLELLGMRDTNQPGILEAQRKQAGMTILATLFDARAYYLKQVGRIRLHFIQNFLSDGRLMRIVGPDGYKAIRLVRDRVAGAYDVDVSEAPTSPDQKQQTWAMLMQLMPILKDRLTPQLAGILLEYSPLPTKAVEQLKQTLLPSPQQQQQQAIQQAGITAKLQSEHAKTDKMVADAEKSRASATVDRAAAAKDFATAILDIAQAGAHVQQQQADALQSALMGLMSSSVVGGQSFGAGGMPTMNNGSPMFAIEPQGATSPHQLPQAPSLPAFGSGGKLPPNLMELANLMKAGNAPAGAGGQPMIQ